MANSILLTVDLSEEAASLSPLKEALRLLDDNGTMHIIAVLPDFGMAQVSGFFKQDFEKDALKAFGNKLKSWVNTNIPDGIDVRPHVTHGTVYDEILRAADKLAVDTIVMGALRPEFSDYLLGPNAARVVRHAKQSVYVVRN
ncbi:universal stress protein [Marivivens aquimaris]|uniref:universal stress protein n=1 Tax=Marivivens aquimaris TaxID=2774876 RepID=UPI00187F4578|nr:universal stress protein [Marivivens aquimaris]